MLERDRSEELAKRMTKSLKSRASAEVMSAEGGAGGEADGAGATATMATENGLAIGSENGDEVCAGC